MSVHLRVVQVFRLPRVEEQQLLLYLAQAQLLVPLTRSAWLRSVLGFVAECFARGEFRLGGE